MRTFSLLLILLTPLAWTEAHQHQHSIRSTSHRLVKRSVTHHGQSSQRKEGSTTDSTMQKAVIPKAHDSLWPAFCIHHLLNDPEHCSSWDIDRKGNPKLEFALYGHAEAYIDRGLLDRVGSLIHLIPQSHQKQCSYLYCSECSHAISRRVECEDDEDHDDDEEEEDEEDDEDDNDDDDDDDEENGDSVIMCKCNCILDWFDQEFLDEGDELADDWERCTAPSIYNGYFDWHHQTYFRYLEQFLLYETQNTSCSCYWPQVEDSAREISDHVYTRLRRTFRRSKFNDLRSTFSPYLKHRSLRGFASGLTTHAFFYSQYRNILLDLDQQSCKVLPTKDYLSVHHRLLDLEESIQKPFLTLYDRCLQHHPHPKIYYERGMVLFHQGCSLDSLDDIRRFIAYAEEHHDSMLTSELYLQEGRLFSEVLSYDEAVTALTRAIGKDPSNKEAYFERAIAYFETGDFSKALSDYLASGIKTIAIASTQSGKINALALAQGIALGVLQGGQASISEFVPSALSSLMGISRGLWAFVSQPIAASQELVESAYACVEFIKENTTKEKLSKLVPELQACFEKWDRLDDHSKGKYIGYVIGKYGIDLFAGCGSLKAMQLYRNLRRANAIMTLETASISSQLAKEVAKRAVIQKEIRKTVLRSGNLKIQWDKQGKHIQGHKNYRPDDNKSILLHQDPQKLINRYAGTGQQIRGKHPGKPGYKEDVDFKELIGYFVDRNTGEQIPTTLGRIHYAKDGVHLVPVKPRG